MNIKFDYPAVSDEINNLIGLVPQGIIHQGVFNEIKGISIVKDKLFYQNKNNKNNEKKCIIFTPFNISNPDYKLTETFVKYLRLL